MLLRATVGSTLQPVTLRVAGVARVSAVWELPVGVSVAVFVNCQHKHTRCACTHEAQKAAASHIIGVVRQQN